MSTSTWTGAVNSDWGPDNWSPASVPGASSDVEIAAGAPVASASIGTVNSITDSSDLSFESAGTNTVAAFLDDAGHVRVDADGGEGGTILNIGGTLTNSSRLRIGNATLSASDEVAAASLDNTGRIYLTGSSANQALLDVSGSAGFGTAEVFSGYAKLSGDSAIEFASGEITSLAASAHLGLVGNDAFIEDSTATGSNSALMGLASIGAGALFALHDGASVSTTGALANDGTVVLDSGRDDGGSSLTVGGTLTNSRSLTIGNPNLSAPDSVTAASLDNTGRVVLLGSDSNKCQALLDVTAGSAGFGTTGTLTGSVDLFQDSAIEFLSGQINTIAASSELTLEGDSAFIEDSTALGSNSALTGLADIKGSLSLEDGASVSTTGGLVNNGTLRVGASRGSLLSVAGTLTNTGNLSISGDSVTAKSFANSGTVSLSGATYAGALNVSGALTNNGAISTTENCALNVSGATTNNGSISIFADTEGGGGVEFAGAVGGTGSFSLSGDAYYAGDLQFDSSVSSGQTIVDARPGSDQLTLKEAQEFAATIKGFGTKDTIDATNFVETATTYDFVENSAMTGGTLTLTDTSLSLTANILMTGHYSNSDFTLAPDSGTGTLVKFV
jgi:hypothetical protein